MIEYSRPLTRYVVGISVSESNDSESRGFPRWQVNRVTLQIAAALFGQGATLVFGHDWREDGVMEAAHSFAQQVQSPFSFSPENAAAEREPILWNLIAWPDKPTLAEAAREELKSTLKVESVGLPDGMSDLARQALAAGEDSALYRRLRSIALSYLRGRLNEECQARLCLGGRTSGFAGSYPGIVEEAFLALNGQKALYLAGLLGGATAQLIEAIKGVPMPADFCSAQEEHVGDVLSLPVQKLSSREEVWAAFQDCRVVGLTKTNALTAEENSEMFETPSIDRLVQLTLTGLSRLTT